MKFWSRQYLGLNKQGIYMYSGIDYIHLIRHTCNTQDGTDIGGLAEGYLALNVKLCIVSDQVSLYYNSKQQL